MTVRVFPPFCLFSSSRPSAMATTEHPLKKRKLYEPSPPLPQSPPPPLPPQPPPLPQQQPALTFQQSNAAPALSQDEILRRRRNQEEIRNVYECFKRIKFCISQNDDRLSSELEQAYLSLITASRGLYKARFFFLLKYHVVLFILDYEVEYFHPEIWKSGFWMLCLFSCLLKSRNRNEVYPAPFFSLLLFEG